MFEARCATQCAASSRQRDLRERTRQLNRPSEAAEFVRTLTQALPSLLPFKAFKGRRWSLGRMGSCTHPNSDESGYAEHAAKQRSRTVAQAKHGAAGMRILRAQKSPVSHTGPELETVRRPRCHALRSSAVINAARSSEVRKEQRRLKVTKRIMATPEKWVQGTRT